MKKPDKTKESGDDRILKILVSIDGRITNIEERMSGMATKDDLIVIEGNMVAMEKRLLDEIRPIARAVDKDALTIINHEKRISRLEKREVVK